MHHAGLGRRAAQPPMEMPRRSKPYSMC